MSGELGAGIIVGILFCMVPDWAERFIVPWIFKMKVNKWFSLFPGEFFERKVYEMNLGALSIQRVDRYWYHGKREYKVFDNFGNLIDVISARGDMEALDIVWDNMIHNKYGWKGEESGKNSVR